MCAVLFRLEGGVRSLLSAGADVLLHLHDRYAAITADHQPLLKLLFGHAINCAPARPLHEMRGQDPAELDLLKLLGQHCRYFMCSASLSHAVVPGRKLGPPLSVMQTECICK